MEPIIFIILIAFGAIVYNYYSSRENIKNGLKLVKENEKNTEIFVSEVRKIGEEYERTSIPTIDSDLALKRDETLHVRLGSIQWMEYRRKRAGTTAQGLTARVEIAKGLYYKAGMTLNETIDQLTPIDNGDLYFTNKGVLFRGHIGNKSISYEKIVMLTPFRNGIKIERETGKDIYISYNIKPEHAAAIILLWDKTRSVN
jgi:hypothetical protein